MLRKLVALPLYLNNKMNRFKLTVHKMFFEWAIFLASFHQFPTLYSTLNTFLFCSFLPHSTKPRLGDSLGCYSFTI